MEERGGRNNNPSRNRRGSSRGTARNGGGRGGRCGGVTPSGEVNRRGTTTLSPECRQPHIDQRSSNSNSKMNSRGRGSYGGSPSSGGSSSIPMLTFSSNPLACDVPAVQPVKKPWKEPHFPDLEDQRDHIKTLMPSYEKLGDLKESTIDVLTNHWAANITLPAELHRYEVDIHIEKERKAPPPPTTTGKGRNNGSRTSNPPDNNNGETPTKKAEGPVINKDVLKKIHQVLLVRLKEKWAEKNKKKTIGIITDFSRIVITSKKLDSAANLAQPIRIDHRTDLKGEDECPQVYVLTLREAKFEVDLATVQKLIDQQPRMKDHPSLLEVKQVYNILMRNLGPEKYVSVGRSSLLRAAEPAEDNYLGQGLMNWKGVSLVCTLGATWKPFINVEVQNSAFLIGQPVLHAIAEMMHKSQRNEVINMKSRHTPEDFAKATNVTTWDKMDFELIIGVLKSCKVRRTVAKKGLMDSRVDGICGFGSDPSQHRLAADIKFNYNGVPISVANYYKDILNIKLTYPKGPILRLGKGFVPAEVCTIKDGQSINRLLQGNAQKRMLDFCTEKPSGKIGSINNSVKDLNLMNHELLKEFGLSIPKNEMHELKGTRVLPAPKLCYGEDTTPGCPRPGKGRLTPVDGVWDIWKANVKFYKPAAIENWAIISVDKKPADEKVKLLFEALRHEGTKKGMGFPKGPPLIMDINIKNQLSHRKTALLEELFQVVRNRLGGNPAKLLVICIIPQKPNDCYAHIKQAAEQDGRAAPVLTQCIQDANVSGNKDNTSVIRNILLKINTKFGGINHVPEYPQSLSQISILSVPTLIIGIDVNHPSIPIQGKPVGYPSFASVTGSLDRTGMPYMMYVQAQIRFADRAIGSAEVVENLDVIVGKMLQEFRKKCGYKPMRIIVFRDGVGDSQFPEVLQKEMVKIRKACTDLHVNFKPPITFLAVQKRHKVRFFGPKSSNGERVNVPPGTVVDRDIVNRSDFYMLSHKGILGTSRPTHYHVLWDDSDFSMDEIQGLSYFLCYNYSRCNRSVSYPAPTYYAHWAAFRAKELASGYRDWAGDQESLDRLNKHLQRSPFITDGFPMHFI